MEGQGQKVLIITYFAEQDFEREYDYYLNQYPNAAAEKLKLGFGQIVFSILPNPYIYPECRFLPTKTQMYRNIVWGNYLILYRIKKNTIEVLSLFHTKQKPSRIRAARLRK